MNTTDPIIPGSSAAGVRIGDPIQAIVDVAPGNTVERFHGTEKYSFETVTLWVKDGCVTQIGLRAPYSGKLSSGIGIGSTIRDVELTLGPVTEDEGDNLVVAGSLGWCFETESWVSGRTPGKNSDARISEIFVFASGG